MSKELYAEALADAKKLKEIAEDNAKRALIEAVTPRIRDLIEKQLLNEDSEPTGEVAGEPGGSEMSGEILTDTGDDAGDDTSEEYSVNNESIASLAPLLSFKRQGNLVEFESNLFRLGENIARFKNASGALKETSGYKNKILEMISSVENMYDYVQNSVDDSTKKSDYELKLESYFKTLNMLQEQNMSRSRRNYLSEADVTLKLTGMPDEMDLDSIGVDLITGEADEEGGEEEGGEEEGGEEDLDLGGEEEGEEGAEEEGGEEEGGEEGEEDLDLGGEEEEGGQTQQESRMFNNNVIVEIDEGMLRREISRMKMLREAGQDQGGGQGQGGGDGDDDLLELDMGEVDEMDEEMDQMYEQDPPDDEGQGNDVNEVDEMDEELDQMYEQDPPDDEGGEGGENQGDLHEVDEVDQVDEVDEVDEAYDEGNSNLDPQQNKQQRSPSNESLRRRYAHEKRLQEGLRNKLRRLQLESSRARSERNMSRFVAVNNAIRGVRRMFAESAQVTRKISRVLAEANSRRGLILNGGPNRPAERLAETNLRNKLAATNLFNAKLIFTNKLLQNDTLSKRQKASVIERLDEARSLREVKLIYESLSSALANNSRRLNESSGQRIIGSSSRPTRPASTTLNEGVETDRWAKLAGITK